MRELSDFDVEEQLEVMDACSDLLDVHGELDVALENVGGLMEEYDISEEDAKKVLRQYDADCSWPAE